MGITMKTHKIRTKSRKGKIVHEGKLLVWTGKVPAISLEIAVNKAWHYFR